MKDGRMLARETWEEFKANKMVKSISRSKGHEAWEGEVIEGLGKRMESWSTPTTTSDSYALEGNCL
jgi:hypothetical protein